MRAAVFDFRSMLPGIGILIEDIFPPATRRVAARGHRLRCLPHRSSHRRNMSPAHSARIIPGLTPAGKMLTVATPNLPPGTIAGVSWISGVDSEGWICRPAMANLCEPPCIGF